MVAYIHRQGGRDIEKRRVGGRKVWAGIQVAVWVGVYNPLKSLGLKFWSEHKKELMGK